MEAEDKEVGDALMAALPYIPLYIADYKADVAHLTLAQRGAYMELIMNYWQTGKALNNADERLATVVGLNRANWLKMKPLLSEFFTIEGDTWTHGRIEFELEKVHTKSTKASYAASEGARKRASERLADAGRTHSHTDTDTDTDIKRKKQKPRTEDLVIDSFFEDFWGVYPKSQGKKAAKIAFEKALKVADPKEIIAGAKRLADSRPDLKFTPLPASWLNGERWLDVVTPFASVPSSVITSPTPTPPPITDQERAKTGVPMPKGLREVAGL